MKRVAGRKSTLRAHGCCRVIETEPLLFHGLRVSELQFLPPGHGKDHADRVRLSCRVVDEFGDGSRGFLFLTISVKEVYQHE